MTDDAGAYHSYEPSTRPTGVIVTDIVDELICEQRVIGFLLLALEYYAHAVESQRRADPPYQEGEYASDEKAVVYRRQ